MTNQPLLPLRGVPKVITNVNFGKRPEPEEPEMVEDESAGFHFLSGMRADAGSDVVTFVGWVLLPDFRERRMMVHFTLPRTVAVELHKALGEQLSEESD